MDKQATIQLIKKMCAKLNGFTDANLTEIDTVIQNYLKEHPADTDMWLGRTMLELTPSWEDPDRMILSNYF